MGEADSAIDPYVPSKCVLAEVTVGVSPPRSPSIDSDPSSTSESDRLGHSLPRMVLDTLEPPQVGGRDRQ